MLTRTDRRRFPILIAAIATLALAGAALGLLLSTVQAQESDEVLLSNFGKDWDDETNFQSSIVFAQGFTTGSNSGGYHLASIELDVERIPGDPDEVTIALWSANSDQEPGASLATLTHSTGTWATGVNTFNAPGDTELDADTRYFVYMAYSGSNPTLQLRATDSTSADDDGAADWGIGPKMRNVSLGGWVNSSDRVRFRINGIQAPEPETPINQPGEIRAYWTDSATNDGNLQAGCAGTEPFRAYWKRPKSTDEWEAEVTAEYGASNVSHDPIRYIGDGFHELTGSVRIQDGEFGVVSIRVRGNFGDDGWGAWSRPTELFCNPIGGL